MTASPEFAGRLASYRSRIETVLDRTLALPDCGTDRLREAMRYSTLAGGKRGVAGSADVHSAKGLPISHSNYLIANGRTSRGA